MSDLSGGEPPPGGPTDVTTFWTRVRPRVQRDAFARIGVVVGPGGSAALAPPAFAFGATREQADEALELVLAGAKTATSSALVEYRTGGEDAHPLPRVGDLSIVLDGSGEPRAVIRTTAVEVTSLGLVGAVHARAEGDGGSAESWRHEHAAFWGKLVDEADDWPVVLERFAVVWPAVPVGAGGQGR